MKHGVQPATWHNYRKNEEKSKKNKMTNDKMYSNKWQNEKWEKYCVQNWNKWQITKNNLQDSNVRYILRRQTKETNQMHDTNNKAWQKTKRQMTQT